MNETVNHHQDSRAKRWRIAAWSAAALLLVLPLFAMQVTDEVTWKGSDLAILAVLLFGALGTLELAARKSGHPAYLAAVGVAVTACFLLIVGNLAVGVIGNEGNPANLIFAGVLAVVFLGALMARFGAGRMAQAMIATTVAQVLVAVVALALGLGSSGPIWPLDILGATAFFTGMWLLSAWLFRKAAGKPTR